MKNKVLLIIVGVMLVLSAIVVYETRDNDKEVISQANNYSKEYMKNMQNRAKEAEANKEKMIEKLKGVVCWGGSNTQGAVGISYVDMLYDRLKEEGYDIPVENMGISSESSIDILGRQGSVPIILSESAEIEGSNKIINNIKIKSSAGAASNILCGNNNPGVNPCVINGVKGTVFGETAKDDATKTSAFYFQRESGGNKVIIPAGAVVKTGGSDVKYKDYINIMWLERKGWSTPKELMEQEEKFIKSINGKYIIIGLSDGDEEKNTEIDKLMEEKFGDKYINPRKILVEYSKQKADKNITEYNKEKLSKGMIPSDLADNNGLLSVTGCRVLSENIYNKIKSLGYLN